MGVGGNVLTFLRCPLPFPCALLFPLVIAEPLDRSPPPVWVLLRSRKVHGDQRDIRTPAYLHPIKVMTVKILLGSCVTTLDLLAHFIMLSSDDGVTTTGRILETLAIEKSDATANRLDKFTVL